MALNLKKKETDTHVLRKPMLVGFFSSLSLEFKDLAAVVSHREEWT
jgi:hypothetical protein